MLVACRLAGLSALERHYAGLNARMQFGLAQGSSGHSGQRRIYVLSNLQPFEAERLSIAGWEEREQAEISLTKAHLAITHRPSSPSGFLRQTLP
jgi:hypothetical protein